MTAKQFKAAFAIAESSRDLSQIDDSIIHGYGLPEFRPVFITLEVVAKEIRWAARQFNGQWNQEALTELARLGRKNFQIVD